MSNPELNSAVGIVLSLELKKKKKKRHESEMTSEVITSQTALFLCNRMPKLCAPMHANDVQERERESFDSAITIGTRMRTHIQTHATPVHR